MKLIDKMLPAGRGVAVARTRRRCATALLLAGMSGSAFSAPQDLLKPAQLIADGSLPAATRAANEYVARQYATFWNTGDDALARAALAENFIDKTPPEGRRQGPEGAILASRAFRQAVPDLRCDVEQMIVAGDRVVSHLHFHGPLPGPSAPGRGRDKISILSPPISIRSAVVKLPPTGILKIT